MQINKFHNFYDLCFRWTIRARVTQKQAIKNYTNARGAGKLFNMVLTDESGDIRCTGFNDQVDKFYDMIEMNKVCISQSLADLISSSLTLLVLPFALGNPS